MNKKHWRDAATTTFLATITFFACFFAASASSRQSKYTPPLEVGLPELWFWFGRNLCEG